MRHAFDILRHYDAASQACRHALRARVARSAKKCKCYIDFFRVISMLPLSSGFFAIYFHCVSFADYCFS
jgi:hypothetical protein